MVLDFENSKTLDPRITFTRSSVGTYVGADGLIKTAAADEARFDHDANGESLGLLIEEQRINHALYSKDFTTSFAGGWIDNGNLPIGNITENYDVAPDGTLTATKIVNFTGVPKFLRQLPYYSVAYRTTGIHTISLFAKPISTSFCRIRLNVYDGSTDMGTFYDLLTGSISSDYGNPVDNSITPIGNGWYRITHTTNNSGVGDHQIHLENNSECLIWGAQYERGNFATSFISTTTSQVTRQPDSASITGTNFSSWYSPFNGTYIIDIKNNSTNTSGLPSPFRTNSIFTFLGASGYYTKNTTSNVQIAQGPTTTNLTKWAIYHDGSNGYGMTINGRTPVSGTQAIGTSDTNIQFNDIQGATSFYLNRLAYYPERLTNDQLQTLTK